MLGVLVSEAVVNCFEACTSFYNREAVEGPPKQTFLQGLHRTRKLRQCTKKGQSLNM